MARYEIDSDNAIRIWFDENAEAPGLLQPTWPDGTAWGSKKAAETWAKAYIASIEDPTAPLAGDNPKTPTVPRPEPVEVAPEPTPES